MATYSSIKVHWSKVDPYDLHTIPITSFPIVGDQPPMKWLWNQPVRESEPTSPTISLSFFLFAWMKYHWETDHQPSIMYQQCSHMAVPYRLWRWRFQRVPTQFPLSQVHFLLLWSLWSSDNSVRYLPIYWIFLWNKTLKYGFDHEIESFDHFWSPKVLHG